jgi:hypothetical protein
MNLQQSGQVCPQQVENLTEKHESLASLRGVQKPARLVLAVGQPAAHYHTVAPLCDTLALATRHVKPYEKHDQIDSA